MVRAGDGSASRHRHREICEQIPAGGDRVTFVNLIIVNQLRLHELAPILNSLCCNFNIFDEYFFLFFSQPRIDSFFMTYHDTNRAAKFRSTRLGAAVEQITGKRTELFVNPGGGSKAKQKRVKPGGEKDNGSGLPSPTKTKQKTPTKTAAKRKGRAAPAVNSSAPALPISVPVPVCAASPTPTKALSHTPERPTSVLPQQVIAAVEREEICVVDLGTEDEDDDSDGDIFDDDYKKRKKNKNKGKKVRN